MKATTDRPHAEPTCADRAPTRWLVPGGLTLALLGLVDSAALALLAERMSAGQQSEIDTMQDMLHQRGLAPEPEDPSEDHGQAHSG